MKTAAEWYQQMQNEAAHGWPCVPMLERIAEIQKDALTELVAPTIAEENDILTAQVTAMRKLQKQINNLSAIADIVDRQLGVEPDRSTTPDKRISHILSGLLEALTRQKKEGK